MFHRGQTVPVKSAQYSGPTNTSNLPLVLTKQQLAAIFGCTTRHLDNLTRRGSLPAVHLGRLVRYRRETVLRSLANMEDSESHRHTRIRGPCSPGAIVLKKTKMVT